MVKEQRRKSVHPRMSVEWLREFAGFENYTDSQALEAIETIRALGNIMMGIYKKNKSSDDEHQLHGNSP